jgi:hypothetical protein
LAAAGDTGDEGAPVLRANSLANIPPFVCD